MLIVVCFCYTLYYLIYDPLSIDALAKPRRAMSVAQNIHAFLDQVFRDIFMR